MTVTWIGHLGESCMIQQIHISLNVYYVQLGIDNLCKSGAANTICENFHHRGVTTNKIILLVSGLFPLTKLEERETEATVGLTNGRGSNGIDRLHDGHYTCSSARI